MMMLGLSGPIEHLAQETAQLMLMMLGLSGPIEQVAQEIAQLMRMMLVLSGKIEQVTRNCAADADDARVERPGRVSCVMKVCS